MEIENIHPNIFNKKYDFNEFNKKIDQMKDSNIITSNLTNIYVPKPIFTPRKS